MQELCEGEVRKKPSTSCGVVNGQAVQLKKVSVGSGYMSRGIGKTYSTVAPYAIADKSLRQKSLMKRKNYAAGKVRFRVCRLPFFVKLVCWN